MGPLGHKEYTTKDIRQSVKNGWDMTLKLLPDNIREAFLLPPYKIVDQWKDLPMTLIHGDSKVASFAKYKDGQLCLLDWAFVGHAPCTFELGWFIAANASRLADSKEVVILKYRIMLERHLGYPLTNALWGQLEEAGIVCGAFMLLWTKGTAMSNKREGASVEWNWWINRLKPWISKMNLK